MIKSKGGRAAEIVKRVDDQLDLATWHDLVRPRVNNCCGGKRENKCCWLRKF